MAIELATEEQSREYVEAEHDRTVRVTHRDLDVHFGGDYPMDDSFGRSVTINASGGVA
jgi:hypothetical protein